jgi:hypothetical protein
MPTASTICRVKIEYGSLKRICPMKNVSCHSDLLELVASSPISRIQRGEISKLGWLMGSVKHTIWATPALTFTFQNPSSSLPYITTLLVGMLA